MNFIKERLKYFRDKSSDQHGVSTAPNPQRKKVVVMSAIVVGAIFIFAIIGIPSMTGYAVYRDMKSQGFESADDYSAEVMRLDTELESTKSQAITCESERKDLDEQYTQCTTNLNDMRQTLESENIQLKQNNQMKTDQVNDLNQALKEREDEIKELENAQDQVIKNAANFICCTQKLANNEINYYEIDDDTIECRESNPSDDNEDYRISCF